MKFQTSLYGYMPLATKSSNVIQTREATHSAKPKIMAPRQNLVPPEPRLGYQPATLPTWCSWGQVCDGILTPEYQKRMGKYLPPRSRADVSSDVSIARFS